MRDAYELTITFRENTGARAERNIEFANVPQRVNNLIDLSRAL